MPHKKPSKKSKRKDPVGGSETTSEEAKSTAPAGSSRTQALRQVYLAVQIKAMQRAAEPLALKYSMETVADVKQLNRTLADLVFSRQLGHHDVQALNGIIRNHLQILIPRPGINVNVAQVMEGPKIDYKRLAEIMSKEDKLAVIRAVKLLESKAGQS